MHKLLILLAVFLSLSNNVQSSVLDYMSEKWSEFKNELFTLFTAAKDGIKHVFSHPGHLNYRSNPWTLFEINIPDINLTCIKTAHTHSTPQLAATHGRIIETHVTYTDDGYILTLHRLSSSKTNSQSEHRQTKRTVFLHHGLLGSSADWIQLGPIKSLPYILFDAGFDVWLANSRGNFYSRTHVSMTSNSEEFWNFSWEEIGEHDLSAALDYIRQKKNTTEPIDYIGHSMGATALLVLLSVKRNYNQYIRMAFLLAPLAYMEHTQGPLQTMAIHQTAFADIFGTRDFMFTQTISKPMVFRMCTDLEIYCKNPLFFLTGSPLQEGTRTAEYTDKLREYIPAGGSARTIMHYLELVKNKKFHRREKPNWKFKTEYITTPMVIFSSNDDILSNAADNHKLYLSISNPIGHILINDQNLSHTEFAWGYNADILLYRKIKDLIDAGPDVNKI